MEPEEGGTELEAEAVEGELEGAVRRTCEDMEPEEGELAGQAEEAARSWRPRPRRTS